MRRVFAVSPVVLLLLGLISTGNVARAAVVLSSLAALGIARSIHRKPARQGVGLLFAAMYVFAVGATIVSFRTPLASLSEAVEFSMFALVWCLYGLAIGRNGESLADMGLAIAGVLVAVIVRSGVPTSTVLSLQTKLEFADLGSPNLYGGIAGVSLIMLLGSWWANRRRLMLVVLGSSAAGWVVLVTFSRSALIGLVATGLALGASHLISRNRRWRVPVVGLAAALGVVLAVLMFGTDGGASDTLLRGRPEVWSASINELQGGWPVGVGYARLQEAVRYVLPYTELTSGSAHSLYLATAAALGLSGLLSLMLLFAWGWQRISRSAANSARVPVVWLSVPFVYGAVRGLVEANGWLIDGGLNVLSALMWLCVGAGAVRAVQRADVSADAALGLASEGP